MRWEKSERAVYLHDLGIGGRKTLKFILKKVSHSGFCKRGNEPLGSLKCWDIFTSCGHVTV